MEVPFTDIPEGKSLDPITFLWGNGYMDPISTTKFGYDVKTTYVELLDTLYRMAGSPNMDNTWVDMGSTRPITGKYLNCVKWASSIGILCRDIETLSSYTPLTRVDACVTLLRYAKLQGYSDAVDDEALLAEMAASITAICRAKSVLPRPGRAAITYTPFFAKPPVARLKACQPGTCMACPAPPCPASAAAAHWAKLAAAPWPASPKSSSCRRTKARMASVMPSASCPPVARPSAAAFSMRSRQARRTMAT